MSDSQLLAVKVIGAYRADDSVLLFLDDPKGWQFWNAIINADRTMIDLSLDVFIKGMAEDPSANMRGDGTLGSVLVLPMSKANLPRDLPDRKIIAIGPDHPADSVVGVPVFVPEGSM